MFPLICFQSLSSGQVIKNMLQAQLYTNLCQISWDWIAVFWKYCKRWIAIACCECGLLGFSSWPNGGLFWLFMMSFATYLLTSNLKFVCRQSARTVRAQGCVHLAMVKDFYWKIYQRRLQQKHELKRLMRPLVTLLGKRFWFPLKPICLNLTTAAQVFGLKSLTAILIIFQFLIIGKLVGVKTWNKLLK